LVRRPLPFSLSGFGETGGGVCNPLTAAKQTKAEWNINLWEHIRIPTGVTAMDGLPHIASSVNQ